MATGEMYRVRTTVTGVPGSPYYINLYYDASAGTADDAATAQHQFLTQGIAGNVLAPATWYTEPDVPVYDSATGQIVRMESWTGAGLTGTNVSEAVPQAAQLLVRWNTGVYVNGRQVKGHTNIPRLPEQDNAGNGTVQPVAMTTWQGRAISLIADPDCTLVVYSRKTGTFEPVTVPAIWNQWAILRSRRG